MSNSVPIFRSEATKLIAAETGVSYNISVQTPFTYDGSDRWFPVLYLADGQWNFPLVTAIRMFLYFDPTLVNLIIVGIGFGGTMEQLVSQRAFDLTPEPGIDIEGQKLGGAAGFLSFIENQVIPYVDQKYRTIPGEQGFLGHSYGGVFGLYTLLNRPHLFQKIAALDPTSVVAKGTLLSKLKEIAPQTKFNSRLYIALGTQEPDASLTENTVFLRALRALRPPGLNYRAGYYAENHSASVPCAIVPALKWLYHPEVPSESYPGENPAQNDF